MGRSDMSETPDSSAETDEGTTRLPVFDLLPADLLAVLILTLGVAFAVTLPGLSETPVRTVLGAFFVLFVPGYAIVSALFPETDKRPVETTADRADAAPVTLQRTVDGPERVLLSIGLSTATAGLSGFALHLSSLTLRPLTVLTPLAVVAVLSTLIAIRRRARIRPGRRFLVPYRRWVSEITARSGGSTVEVVVNVAVVVTILLASSTLGFALLFPQDGEEFTELYLLTENETGGPRMADFPNELVVDETRTVHVGVGNHERQPMNYTLLVELHRVEGNEGSLTVVSSERLARTTLRLRNNETVIRPVSVSPRMSGTQLRLTFLLYAGDPPADPRITNAYRETHLSVNVSE